MPAINAPTVHIVQRLAPGGIETLVLDLATSHGDNIWVFSLEGKTEELMAGWPALTAIVGRVEAFDVAPGLKPWLIPQLGRRLRAIGPRAVFLHHVGPLIYGGLAARLAGIERVIHVEHDVWHYAQPRRRAIAKIVERLVKPHHVAVSSHAAGELCAMLPKPSVSVIPNGIDLGRFKPGDRRAACAFYGLDPDWRIVGTVGRLVAVKGQDILIRAAAQLPAECHVVIAGSGEELGALRALTTSLGLDSRVHFVGHVDKVETVLPAFDVFCLPSRNEGFPRSIIEAQAAGLPVVATDVGALAEAVCPASGRIVPPGDPSALAGAILASLTAAPAAGPRAFVVGRYSWERTLSSYRDLSQGEFKHAA